MRTCTLRARRAGSLAALLVLVLGPVAGCGVQESAVIDAGRPAVADLLPPREGRMLLFFYSPDGRLLPVPRIVDAPWPVPTAGADGPDARAAVAALLAGPDKAERRAGLRSAPSLPRSPSAAADRVVAGGPTVEVRLRLRVTRLPAPARDQLVCTAAFAAHAQGAVSVSLVGQDGRLNPADCPLRPVTVPVR